MTTAQQTGDRTETLTLRDFALASLATILPADEVQSVEAIYLRHHYQTTVQQTGDFIEALRLYLEHPAADDAPLLLLTSEFEFTLVELLTIALLQVVEEQMMAGRVIAYLQAPQPHKRPTLGLVAHMLKSIAPPDINVLDMLVIGNAMQAGVLQVLGDEALPLVDRPLYIPEALRLALKGHYLNWPGTTYQIPDIPLPQSIQQEAQRQAVALQASQSLIIRTGMPAEGRAVAAYTAQSLGFQPAFTDCKNLEGFAAWLLLRRRIPVWIAELIPGERKALPHIPFYQGPLLVICGPDGSFEDTERAISAVSWTLPVPSPEERAKLWQQAMNVDDKGDLAQQLAHNHRHSSGRIAQLGHMAHHYRTLAGRDETQLDDIVRASREGEGLGLDALAHPLRSFIPEDALVVSEQVEEQLYLLTMRCQARDGLANRLGVSASVRYRPGVRALLAGPSGTGKTLAALWLSSRLGLPLYRVDLAAVTSKYIGETEKNLAQLLARAEQAEVVLLFDEADSMFGKRTEVKEANDRFANAQTNYLLQRLENYDGITLLTSNNRNRLDSAFTRRLDMIIEFELPTPNERLRLWYSHLGDAHDVSRSNLKKLAAVADLTGGHIRNAVLTAAVISQTEQRAINYNDILRGLDIEYRKQGKKLPHSLLP